MAKQIKPVEITHEKAERIIRVMEQILSRKTGKKIEIESYKIKTEKSDKQAI